VTKRGIRSREALVWRANYTREINDPWLKITMVKIPRHRSAIPRAHARACGKYRCASWHGKDQGIRTRSVIRACGVREFQDAPTAPRDSPRRDSSRPCSPFVPRKTPPLASTYIQIMFTQIMDTPDARFSDAFRIGKMLCSHVRERREREGSLHGISGYMRNAWGLKQRLFTSNTPLKGAREGGRRAFHGALMAGVATPEEASEGRNDAISVTAPEGRGYRLPGSKFGFGSHG